MVNHYPLVSSPGGLYNRDLIIEQVRECSPTILLVLPDQETVLRFVALFWEWVRQRAIERQWEREREGVERRNEPKKCMSPATCLPSHRRAGLCGFTVAEMSQRACAFNLALKSMDQNSSVQSFVSDVLMRQGAVSVWTWTHFPLQMMPEHSVLQAVQSTQNCICNKPPSGSVTSASN